MRLRPRVEAAWFEALYRDEPDPWGFATSAYERDKYRHTLDAIGDGRIARALEVGCSIGVFTAALAPRCEELVAVDVSETALARARARLAGAAGVRLERRELPEEMPPGRFDLVVLAEVAYYWPREVARAAARRLADALTPGGRLVAVHWRPPTRTYPLTGDEVHDLLAEELGELAHVHADVCPAYRLDRFDRVSE